jgi:hypothetical protein
VDLAAIEQRLGDRARVCLVERRLLRRVIKQHRGVNGVVPHARCYALSFEELARCVAPAELGLEGPQTRPLILVARPPLGELKRLEPAELFERVLRAAFHARVHLELEERAGAGALGEPEVRRRVERIGRAAFEELRAVFVHDDLLLPPAGDLEVYIEFAATYLELTEFSPELLLTTFPGLEDSARIEAILALDLDLGAHLSEAPIPLLRPSPAASDDRDRREAARRGWFFGLRQRRLLAAAERALGRGQHARSALLSARVRSEPGERVLRSAVEQLSCRLDDALDADAEPDRSGAAWADALAALATRAAQSSGWRWALEAKLLISLELAASDHEQPGVIVDVPSWLLSGGKRRAVRSRAPNRSVRVARRLRFIADQVARLQTPPAERAALQELVQSAARTAEQNARRQLRPQIRAALEAAGLVAASEPERHAENKLIEELCDQVLSRGFLSLPQLRDAVSENELKLEDLSSARELWRGDPLLQADANLALAIDGFYRRGDAYLRALQKLSSLPFGTPIGRLLTLFVLLPVLGSFLLLEGIRLLLVHPLDWLGLPAIEPFGWKALAVTAALLLALLHSGPFRAFARQLLDLVALVLAWIFFRIPRFIVAQPFLRRLLARPIVRAAIRRALLPAAIGAVVWFVTPGTLGSLVRALLVAAGVAAASLILGSRLGLWLEGYLVEQIAPTWRVLSRRWLPEILRLIIRIFAALIEGLDRLIHRIDDWIGFQRSRSRAVLAIAGAAGVLWAGLAYVIRFYITLLVEPELNPVKHFPIVTVMHKLTLPLVPGMIHALEKPLSVFGPIIGGAIAGITVFLHPSIFGFLAWELKANYALYQATQSAYVRTARMGPHGETLRELLVPGLHSGRVPKLYERLRRAAERHAEQRRSGRTETPELERFRQGLRDVQLAVQRFVERELFPPLSASPRWTIGPLAVARVGLSPHRIRIHLRSGNRQDDCELVFEQLGGRMVAAMPSPGFVSELDPDAALLFENVLAVFYHRADVDLVREQIARELGPGAEYEINDEGLLVFLDDRHQTELRYRLDVYRPRKLRPRLLRSDRSAEVALRRIDSRCILYAQQRILRADWHQAWLVATRAEGALPRLSPAALFGGQPPVQSA